MTIILLVLFVYIIILQSIRDIKNYEKFEKTTFGAWLWDKFYIETDSPPIADNQSIYGDDLEDIQIKTLYVTVLPTTDDSGKKVTFNDLNEYSDFTAKIPSLNMNFTEVVNLNPNNFDMNPSGVITLRGHSTMEAEQKSYKLKVFKDEDKKGEEWYGQNIIHLNKHAFDSFRVRNKIAFDLIELVPNIISIRTRFVHLYIKDLSESRDSNFMDYGLFTNIEQTNNKDFLKEHNLDPEGSLYKVEEFEFLPYEELKDVKDRNYDKEKFETRLEIKDSKSHKKIIEMNEDVNNYHLDIDKVLNKHFNRENYFTWLAVNILLGNYDTQTQNFFLYSPHDALTWYFIPWDYDGSMGEDKELQYDKDGNFIALVGIQNYWNSTLHQRVFQVPHNVDELNKKIEEVYKILSKERIEQVVNKYMPIVEKYFLNDPSYVSQHTSMGLSESAIEIINSTTVNRDLYYESLEKPMPVYLGEVYKEESEDEGYTFEWTESYDLQGDRLTYTLDISNTPGFEEITRHVENIRENFITIDIEPGEYYWRLIVVDKKGNTQRAFDMIQVDDGLSYFGIKKSSLE